MSDDCDGELTISIDSFVAEAGCGGGASQSDCAEAREGDRSASVAAVDSATAAADAAWVSALESATAAAALESATAEEAVEAGIGETDVPEVSRKVTPRFRGRRDRPRSKTIALKRLTRAELRRGAELYPPIDDVDDERPRTREDCRDAPRPCPWVACKHHLYLDINPRTGSIKINFPDLEPWELPHTCALDVADSGGLTLEEIGLITNLTRERVRQVEVRGLLTLRARSRALR